MSSTASQAIEQPAPGVLLQTAEFALEGMTCAACAARIEKTLRRVPGVDAHVNFASERARVQYDPGRTDIEAMVAAVSKAGYGARPVTGFDDSDERRRHESAYRATLREFWIAALLTAPLLAQMAVMFTTVHGELLPRWLQCSRRPCSCGLGGVFMPAPGTRCAGAAPVWMC